MANTTVYKLLSDERSAVDGYLKVVRAQKKAEKGAANLTRGINRQQKAMKSATATGRGLGASLKGALIGGFSIAAAQRLVSGFSQTLTELASKRIGFEREITGLLSLGENLGNIGEVKKDVLDLSTAIGTSTQEIADFLFFLQSSSAGLSAGVIRDLKRESIELSDVTGTDLAISLFVLSKAFRSYGDQVKDVAELQNKLFVGAERGVITFEELGDLLPDILPVTKAFSISLEEVLATLIVATQQLGKNEKTFTSFRNVIINMNNAEREGIKLTGTLVNRFKQMETIDPDVLVNIFGKRSVALAAAIADNAGNVNDELVKLNELTGDPVGEKFLARLADQAFRLSEGLKQTNQELENIAKRGAEDIPALKAERKVSAQKLGLRTLGLSATLTENAIFKTTTDLLIGANQLTELIVKGIPAAFKGPAGVLGGVIAGQAATSSFAEILQQRGGRQARKAAVAARRPAIETAALAEDLGLTGLATRSSENIARRKQFLPEFRFKKKDTFTGLLAQDASALLDVAIKGVGELIDIKEPGSEVGLPGALQGTRAGNAITNIVDDNRRAIQTLRSRFSPAARSPFGANRIEPSRRVRLESRPAEFLLRDDPVSLSRAPRERAANIGPGSQSFGENREFRALAETMKRTEAEAVKQTSSLNTMVDLLRKREANGQLPVGIHGRENALGRRNAQEE